MIGIVLIQGCNDQLAPEVTVIYQSGTTQLQTLVTDTYMEEYLDISYLGFGELNNSTMFMHPFVTMNDGVSYSIMVYNENGWDRDAFYTPEFGQTLYVSQFNGMPCIYIYHPGICSSTLILIKTTTF